MYICKLNELPINKSGYIENVKAHDALKRRLLDLGFIKNTKIKPYVLIFVVALLLFFLLILMTKVCH